MRENPITSFNCWFDGLKEPNRILTMFALASPAILLNGQSAYCTLVAIGWCLLLMAVRLWPNPTKR